MENSLWSLHASIFYLLYCFFFLSFFKNEVQLIYNIVLVSGVQQGDSVTHTCESCFIFSFIMIYHGTSSVAQCWRTHLPMQETQEMWVWYLGWEDPWARQWQPTPVFLPGEPHGQRSLEGYSPWGHRVRQDWTHTHVINHRILNIVSCALQEDLILPLWCKRLERVNSMPCAWGFLSV